MSKHPNMWIAAAAILLLVPPTLSQARTSMVAGLKTAGACTDEYKANKGALKDAKEKKKDFMAACRCAAAWHAHARSEPRRLRPLPLRRQPQRRPQRLRQRLLEPSRRRRPQHPPAAPSRRAEQPAAPGESACGTGGYAHLPASHTAAQFCDEGQAKSHCPSQAVVWTNTKSKIYHHAGANTYGHTKEGAYMCEADATAEGDRLSKNGH